MMSSSNSSKYILRLFPSQPISIAASSAMEKDPVAIATLTKQRIVMVMQSAIFGKLFCTPSFGCC
ncbi:MAG: hypothetical protein WBA07_31670 [Rivularia sp. (in: cyanobacteria)]